jgi:outer membrane protein OmpA-like peptidoglycan-associated protein
MIRVPVRFRSLAACLLLAVAGCAAAPPAPQPPPAKAAVPRDTVVLLPDADGRTGVATVTTPGGAQRLSRPMEATTAAAGEAPAAPYLLDEQAVRALAGGAMDARPEAPARFLLYFSKGTAELTDDSEPVFGEAVRAIKARGAVDVSVVGHSDTLGDKAFNDRLALKRAKTIAARLTGEGVPEAILEVTSHGKDNLLVPTADQVAEPKNRRVEITVR